MMVHVYRICFHPAKAATLYALFVSSIAACSGASSSITTCAAGTQIVGSECIAIDAAAPFQDGSTDAPTTEGGAFADAGPDISDSGAAPPANRCPSAHGPKMAEIPGPTGTYCVDTTEVTNKQYKEMIDDPNHFQTTPANHCSPGATEPPIDANGRCGYDPATKSDFPVRCVDWCEAMLYCRWAGKRLCGQLGGRTLAIGSANDPNASQWYRACSEAGANKWTYGNTSVKGCNEYHDITSANAAAVGSYQKCHPPNPPYSALLDMTANVSEWEDSCDSNDMCLIRGGTYNSVTTEDTCSNAAYTTKVAYRGGDEYTGFRCCAD